MQIRTRLTLQFIILVAGILLLSLCFIYFEFKQMAMQEFYTGLRSKAFMTAEMILVDESQIQSLSDTAALHDPDHRPLPFRENIVIYNEQSQRVFAFNRMAPPLPEKILTALWAEPERKLQNGNHLSLSVRHTSKTGRKYLIIAESVFNTGELKKLRNILVVTFFLGIGIVAAGGWMYASQAMSPVARIVDQVDKILPVNLGARLNTLNNHDEISRLALTFNRLLDRIQVAFKMQKNFISNVSHELKNPLSVIISQLEISLDKKHRSENEYRETLASVLEDTRGLTETSEKLLQLAYIHSENENIQFEQIRLDETVLQTRASLLRAHPEYNITFDMEGSPDNEEQLCVHANDALMRLAILNLMDNGCKFSPDKKVNAKIVFEPNGNRRLEISDRGPGIPEKDIDKVFTSFFRSSNSIHVRGSGIGLALVESIFRIHHISLDVVSGKETGTVFKMFFPIEK